MSGTLLLALFTIQIKLDVNGDSHDDGYVDCRSTCSSFKWDISSNIHNCMQ